MKYTGVKINTETVNKFTNNTLHLFAHTVIYASTKYINI